MDQQNNTSVYEQRKLTLEQMEAIEEVAAAAVAETNLKVGAAIGMYNSLDNLD